MRKLVCLWSCAAPSFAMFSVAWRLPGVSSASRKQGFVPLDIWNSMSSTLKRILKSTQRSSKYFEQKQQCFQDDTLKRSGLECAGLNGALKKMVWTFCGLGAGILVRCCVFIKLIADREHWHLWPYLTFKIGKSWYSCLAFTYVKPETQRWRWFPCP